MAVPMAAVRWESPGLCRCFPLSMSPIFPCKGCGTFIERSAQHYRRMSGQVLCSTCADARREREARSRLHPLQRLLASLRQRLSGSGR